jgi:TonB-dependent receptor
MQLNCNNRLRRAALLLGSASAFSLALGGAAFAQEMETVVVTGMRASLQSAQAIKQKADTVVDSITATDIGALPDKSVAEALKRVPGVTVSQYASPGDSAHFSAEPSSVLIRGLTQVRSEFNGRDVFQADSSRGLSFADVSPELMAAVDAYKNQTADLIEGGLAGTVNLRTRLPFDTEGRVISATAKLNWGTLAHRATPDFSGIYSDRFNTKIGEFGVMVQSAYSMVKAASDGMILGRIFQFTNDAFKTPNTPSGTVWIPTGSNAILTDLYTRERIGGAGAVQWQNPSRTVVATVQYNLSHYREAFTEHRTNFMASGSTNTDGQIQPVPSEGAQLPLGNENDWVVPVPGTSFTFDKNGMFTSGQMLGKAAYSANWSATQWTDASGTAHSYFNECYDWMIGWTGCTANDPRGREQPWISNESRYNTNIRDVGDLSGNVKWDPTDNLHMNFDLQWVHSTVTAFDMVAGLKSHELYNLSVSDYGMTVTDKGPGGPSAGRSLAPTPTSLGIDMQPGGWANLANYYPEFAMDHIERDKGNEVAWRADAQYDFHSKWLDSVKFGVRSADRNQEVDYSAYNWQSVCAAYASCPADHQFANTFPKKYFDTYTFPDVLGGGAFPKVALPYITIDTMANKAAAKAMLSAEGGAPTSNWHQICDRPAEMANSCFTPGEILKIDERTWSGYAMLKFGGSDLSFFNDFLNVSGNIGVRIVNTTITSSGGVNFPSVFVRGPDTTNPVTGLVEPNPYDYIPADDKAFSNAGSAVDVQKHSYTHVLPSLNVRLDLPSDWVVRVAASRAMSRPDLGLLRNYTTLSHTNAVTFNNAVPAPLTQTYTADTGNPGLKPMYADMVDLSVERYFSNVGNFAVDVFYKRFHDYFQYAHYYRDFTNNGVTRNALIRGPVNAKGGELEGVEAAYTRYFDFLPDPFDGLGIQGNVVALHNVGVSSANLASTTAAGSTGFQNLPLEGLSSFSWNLIAMYEKGPLGIRLAYDWRSKYMVTAADCCGLTDMWQRPYGQLDGSVRYAFGDHWETSLQASNILGARSVLQQQVNDPRILMPRSWFEQDRRVEFSVRMKY